MFFARNPQMFNDVNHFHELVFGFEKFSCIKSVIQKQEFQENFALLVFEFLCAF